MNKQQSKPVIQSQIDGFPRYQEDDETISLNMHALFNSPVGKEVLKYLKESGISRTKSGIMLGLGEKREEVLETLDDLRRVGVDIVTLGQYLQPSKKHLPVVDFITPDEFKEYEIIGKEMGFRHVESGPLVRSSYKAHKHIH